MKKRILQEAQAVNPEVVSSTKGFKPGEVLVEAAYPGMGEPKSLATSWEALKANIPLIRKKTMTVTLPQRDPIKPMSSTTDGIHPVISDPKAYYFHPEHQNVFHDPVKFNELWDDEMTREAFLGQDGRTSSIFGLLAFLETMHGPDRNTLVKLLSYQFMRDTGIDAPLAWHKAYTEVNGIHPLL